MSIAAFMHIFVLAILPFTSIAERKTEIEMEEMSPKGSAEHRYESMHPFDTFECPAECWECCAAKRHSYAINYFGTSETKFKCILRAIDKLPQGRKCKDPEFRANEPDSFKTVCYLHPGEILTAPTEHCQTHSTFVKTADWLWQKRGEAFNLLNRNMLEMASIIRQIHSLGRQVTQVLPLSMISSIHPIDEVGAIEKTAGRARSALAARDVLDHSPYTLTKELTSNYPALAEFQSITGFYAVAVGKDEYVTFEGNGRCVALLWAFPEGGDMRSKLKIEVTEFVIDSAFEKFSIVKRIQALQKAIGSKEFNAMHPPSLDPDAVHEWALGAKAELQVRKEGKQQQQQ